MLGHTRQSKFEKLSWPSTSAAGFSFLQYKPVHERKGTQQSLTSCLQPRSELLHIAKMLSRLNFKSFSRNVWRPAIRGNFFWLRPDWGILFTRIRYGKRSDSGDTIWAIRIYTLAKSVFKCQCQQFRCQFWPFIL